MDQSDHSHLELKNMKMMEVYGSSKVGVNYIFVQYEKNNVQQKS